MTDPQYDRPVEEGLPTLNLMRRIPDIKSISYFEKARAGYHVDSFSERLEAIERALTDLTIGYRRSNVADRDDSIVYLGTAPLDSGCVVMGRIDWVLRAIMRVVYTEAAEGCTVALGATIPAAEHDH